jgi:hypothetical protein
VMTPETLEESIKRVVNVWNEAKNKQVTKWLKAIFGCSAINWYNWKKKFF